MQDLEEGGEEDVIAACRLFFFSPRLFLHFVLRPHHLYPDFYGPCVSSPLLWVLFKSTFTRRAALMEHMVTNR